jgi:hypothetical protein
MRARDGIRATRVPQGPLSPSSAGAPRKRYKVPPNLHQYSWQVDRALFERLATLAQRDGRSVAGELRFIVRQYLEADEAVK